MKYLTIDKENNKVYFKGKNYTTYFVDKEIFPYKPWKARGYTVGGEIFIRKGTWIGLEKLIIHEIGHILGYDHTWYPYIMHPSWVGRWFWKWNEDENVCI